MCKLNIMKAYEPETIIVSLAKLILSGLNLQRAFTVTRLVHNDSTA